MRSQELKVSPGNTERLASDLRLPVFEESVAEPWPLKMPWEHAIRSFAPLREYYMHHFDSPEQRARDKNPERFSLW
jgi:hypothetical protein